MHPHFDPIAEYRERGKTETQASPLQEQKGKGKRATQVLPLRE